MSKDGELFAIGDKVRVRQGRRQSRYANGSERQAEFGSGWCDIWLLKATRPVLNGLPGLPCFVQVIALERKGRDRPEIAKAWIHTLVTAVRKHDRRHLITVGLLPWSLDRPGLTSGFVPEKVAGELDFIAMHIYPEKGKLDEALETVKGFAAAGKPVIIEEMFPLKCSAKELGQFIDQSRPHATGWIGFYWGKTPDEYRPAKTIGEAITLSWLELFQQKRETVLGEQKSP